MNRLEAERRVVNVDQFDQRETPGMVPTRSSLLLRLLPNAACSGERVVAVAHGIEHRRVAPNQRRETGRDGTYQLVLIYPPAPDPTSPLHQLEVVGRGQVATG